MSDDMKRLQRRPGYLYVVLAGEGPHVKFVEVEDHAGKSVGHPPSGHDGPYWLIEFPDADLQAENAALRAENERLRLAPCEDCGSRQPCGHHIIHERSVAAPQRDGGEGSAEWCEVCEEQIGPLRAGNRKLSAENARLRDRLECSTRCNAGHHTLPLKLWDCPVCRDEREAKVAAQRDQLAEVLQKYGSHLRCCAGGFHVGNDYRNPKHKCECGYRAALAEIDGGGA